MKTLRIEPTEESPRVLLDPKSGEFLVAGNSLLEDVTSFLNPLLGWLDWYHAEPAEKTVVTFKMDSLNTVSTKMILDILLKLEEFVENDLDVTVKWYFKEDDEDMEEVGQEYEDIVEVPFEHISY